MTGLLGLMQEFHREKLAMLLRHEAAARLVAQYDANNTYQYIINREDVQLSWLNQAIADLGGAPDLAAQETERRTPDGSGSWVALAQGSCDL